ncbi:MAG: HSP20 family protein [Parcubacteria group bacterium Gr01-1014_13]|nr:MAG: HSP20 family protein [Parcubacteria group bacterium Gr01-1014_13]
MNKQEKRFSLPLDSSNNGADFSLFNSLKNQDGEHATEGQLAVDVAQTEDELIVVAAMAGTPADCIELHLHNDLLTIRGERKSPIGEIGEHFYQECYWGKFSRSIILPTDVKAEMVQAQYKNGVLIIRLPKANQNNSDIPIMVIEE